MGMGFSPTWLRRMSPLPASHDHFNHWLIGNDTEWSATYSVSQSFPTPAY